MILELKNIDKYYGANHIVKNLDLSVEEGKFITLLGPSGCGKTTILRMIGGFETPTAGAIFLKGKDITHLPPYKRSVNTVFQNYALFPNMTVEQNIAFGLKQKKWSAPQIAHKVAEMLEMIQLNGYAKRKPFELSGGQQQRVAIARAVANDPDILLLDEPLGALDLKLRKQMQFELKSLHHSLNKTFVYVTHDQEEALTMSDQIAVLNNGLLEQLSTGEELYNNPATKFIAHFIGEANFVNATVIQKNQVAVDAHPVPVADHAFAESKTVSLFIRPENIEIKTGSGMLAVTIAEILFVGNRRRYLVKTAGGQEIKVEESTLLETVHRPGEKVFLSWQPEKTKVFGE